MDPSDLNTHLPPRKRLLWTAASSSVLDAHPPPPSPPPHRTIEAARAAAAAAADAAAAARATAAEKAAVAAKARAAARAAMDFLDSFPRTRTGAGLHLLNVRRSRKRHVQLNLLYKPNDEGHASYGSPSAHAPTKRKSKHQEDEEEEVPDAGVESRSNENGAQEECASPPDMTAPVEGTITSVWKFNKSRCSSDGKVLHRVCPSS